MQVAQTREYLVHFQYWTSHRNCYETDSVVVQADSLSAARKVSMDEMGINEILTVTELTLDMAD
jgi:hypothetical protein